MRLPRLSLRARLLAALLAVTTVFLLALGGVALVVVGKRLGADFDGQLQGNAAQPVERLVGSTDGYAVFYSPAHGRTGLISAASQPGHQLQAWLAEVAASPRGRPAVRELTPFTINLDGGQLALRAVWRRVEAKAEINQKAVPRGQAIIVVAKKLSQREAPLRQILLAEVITGAILVALLALFGPWLIRRGLAPLDRMATTADQITTRGDLTARMPDPGDRAEAGRLSAAINTMLDRIQQAFAARVASEHKVRQFAADASHELRTPLTTISGYAELYRQGALGPDRLPDAMRRIEQEAGRMSRLVAELLELARLDRTSSLNLTETDLAALVRDAVADAAAVEPERSVYAEAPAHLVAVVDEPRIRQILANLLANVRAYTPPATPTAVRLAESGPAAVLEVADAGPGMSAEDAARAFDRFHRGSSDGGQSGNDRGGSGLGLSIVQAIARAHGGDAAIESVLGQGTRVRIWLPVKLSPPPSPGGPGAPPRPAGPGAPRPTGGPGGQPTPGDPGGPTPTGGSSGPPTPGSPGGRTPTGDPGGPSAPGGPGGAGGPAGTAGPTGTGGPAGRARLILAGGA
ncbi:MAG TPA: HAMP domain-containing sensor histidine kinase [Streptosporangiaceae bacterium]|jgi:two-component system OmpR family sensor kinase